MEPQEFVRLLKAKNREIALSAHARESLESRLMSEKAFSEDIEKNVPSAVVEQAAELAGERKFRAYYKQIGPFFHSYVLTVNDKVLLITAWRPNKIRQADLARQGKV